MRKNFPTVVLTATLTGFALLGAGCSESGDDTGTQASDTASAPASGDTTSAATTPSTSSTSGGALPRSSENITLAQPAEGATVSGSFTASGKANSPEANVPWQIEDESGKVVADGFATAEGWMDKLYPWRTKVDVSGLEPGTYVFTAMTDDPSGGEEGKPAEEVKATIVVE